MFVHHFGRSQGLDVLVFLPQSDFLTTAAECALLVVLCVFICCGDSLCVFMMDCFLFLIYFLALIYLLCVCPCVCYVLCG